MVDSSWDTGHENLQLRNEDWVRFLKAKRQETAQQPAGTTCAKIRRLQLAQEIGPGLM